MDLYKPVLNSIIWGSTEARGSHKYYSYLFYLIVKYYNLKISLIVFAVYKKITVFKRVVIRNKTTILIIIYLKKMFHQVCY